MVRSLELLGIAVGLAMDTFAVAVAVSAMLGKVTARQVLRLGFHFGLFQALMPVLGWLAGRSVHRFIEHWDHWIAFGLLAFVGLKAIREALSGGEFKARRTDPTRGVSLLMLSVATSIDALAVGLSFAMLRADIWYPSLVIGLVAGGFTVAGMLIGGRLGARLGKRLEILGGAVLLAIGVKILVEHLVTA